MLIKNMPIQRAQIRVAFAAISSLLVAACGTAVQVAEVAAEKNLMSSTPSVIDQCGALVNSFQYPNAEIKSVKTIADGVVRIGGTDVPQHCQVLGAMNKRQGADGRTYEIGFEVRLPKDWNGRFYYQANGGLDGAVLPALGTLGGGPITGALLQGFAVISSDAGHTGPQTPFFGAEPQARLDYGYQAVQKLTPMAKAMVEHAYGKQPHHSYIGGCSNGGRHTLVAASRIGKEYDGYLAGAPGYRLPNAALAQLWGAQQWKTIATEGATVKHPMNPNATLPDLASAFTPKEAQYVSKQILEKCDALDGLKDGLIQSIQACQTKFSIAKDVSTCKDERNGSCLTVAQKSTLEKIMKGGTTKAGAPIYSAFPIDSGIAGSDWSKWKFVNSLALDPLAVGMVFSSPPEKFDPLSLNIDAKLENYTTTTDVYKESALAVMTPPEHNNPQNLHQLKVKGSKIIVYHGVSDPIFSAEDTRQWYERVNKAEKGKAAEFVAYFPVPAMNHCSGGPSADQFDLLTSLVKWVEDGEKPLQVQATARTKENPGGENKELPGNWAANRTRPLCPYPKVAIYNGKGEKENASSFSCR